MLKFVSFRCTNPSEVLMAQGSDLFKVRLSPREDDDEFESWNRYMQRELLPAP